MCIRDSHMGVRLGAALTDEVGFTFMVTNGGVLGGTPIDDNETPSLGWQFAIAPNDDFGLYIGGNHGANGLNGNKDWEHFFDVVLSIAAADALTILFNADFQVDGNVSPGPSFLHGYSLAFIVDVTEHFDIGLRGEILDGNSDSSAPDYLWTGTLTFRYKPIEYLVLSLEGRVEGSENDIYFSRNFTTTTEDGVVSPVPNEKFYGAVIVGATAHFGN